MHPKSRVWERILWLFILTLLGGEILSDAFLNLIGLDHTSIFYAVITNLFLTGFLLTLNQLITKQSIVLRYSHQSKFNWLIFSIILLAIVLINLIGFVNNLDGSFWIVITGISASFLGSIFEETLFRGILFPMILKMFKVTSVKSNYYAICISSLLFALINLSNGVGQSWLTIIGKLGVNFTLAMILCLMYIKMRSLWFPIILHGVWNFMTPYGFNSIANSVFSNNILLIQEGVAILFFLIMIYIVIKRSSLVSDLKWMQKLTQ